MPARKWASMSPSAPGDGHGPPLLARLGLWRLTRHSAVRRWYEWLSARGVVFAQLDLFEREVGSTVAGTPPGAPDGVEIETARARECLPDGLRGAPVAPDDVVVLARRASDGDGPGATVGYCCCTDRRVYVPELRRRLEPPGVYVWRVFVDPAERGRGVGTAIVARAVRLARTETAATTVSALVAPDNLPSRRAFRSLGFAPTVRYTSTGLAGRRLDRERPLGSGT